MVSPPTRVVRADLLRVLACASHSCFGRLQRLVALRHRLYQLSSRPLVSRNSSVGLADCYHSLLVQPSCSGELGLGFLELLTSVLMFYHRRVASRRARSNTLLSLRIVARSVGARPLRGDRCRLLAGQLAVGLVDLVTDLASIGPSVRVAARPNRAAVRCQCALLRVRAARIARSPRARAPLQLRPPRDAPPRTPRPIAATAPTPTPASRAKTPICLRSAQAADGRSSGGAQHTPARRSR